MKMQVIGQNMSLSATEAQKFWPIYKHYADDLHEVNNSKYELLKQHAETWATMTDQDAPIYVRHWMEVDYVPAVNRALPGKKAATFFQLDRRLSMIVDLQLFSAGSVGACQGVVQQYGAIMIDGDRREGPPPS
jgi:hypothetical protein